MTVLDHDPVRSRMHERQLQAAADSRGRRIHLARRAARRAERAVRRAARAGAAVH